MRDSLSSLALAALLLGLALPASSADANPWKSFWTDWHRNNSWPEPFNKIDRQLYAAPFATMIDNGWRTQNTLTDYHFDTETQTLNLAGEHKLHWIATQAPEHRRCVFVLQGPNAQATAVRIDSVQQAAARVVQRGPLPPVLETENQPHTWPAEYFNAIDTAAAQSIPAPRLPARAEGE